ncbi:hypothetical protein [Novosphingobium album (ex Liu et al. 2023)]|uniref:Heme biosynthesis protein HemY n=1 Tax=Novosphingobium album (ex Liu et al. 2023) TaxID=3031130 RepID=A0ABT5WWC7_9SPHN|nr:hypothetical protein [Novosphingobium album (ex Liu et al. 2023)]MDE8654184.1 hypothetical protein [Novosphingobium album (ex Liu et al. 2023)]
MKVVRVVLLIIGILAVLMGLLWVGQGTGLVMWPAESFMLADRKWAVNGAVLAAVGAVVIWLVRCSRQR